MTTMRHIANGLAMYMLVFVLAGGVMYLSARAGLNDDVALFIFGCFFGLLICLIRDRNATST